MPISVVCPACGKKVNNVPEKFAGKKARCPVPNCRSLIEVPELESENEAVEYEDLAEDPVPQVLVIEPPTTVVIDLPATPSPPVDQQPSQMSDPAIRAKELSDLRNEDFHYLIMVRLFLTMLAGLMAMGGFLGMVIFFSAPGPLASPLALEVGLLFISAAFGLFVLTTVLKLLHALNLNLQAVLVRLDLQSRTGDTKSDTSATPVHL